MVQKLHHSHYMQAALWCVIVVLVLHFMFHENIIILDTTVVHDSADHVPPVYHVSDLKSEKNTKYFREVQHRIGADIRMMRNAIFS